jgi:hypothetical protein
MKEIKECGWSIDFDSSNVGFYMGKDGTVVLVFQRVDPDGETRTTSVPMKTVAFLNLMKVGDRVRSVVREGVLHDAT